MKIWEYRHDEALIRVENELFAERLIIDGAVVDSHSGARSSAVLRAISPFGAVRAELSEGSDEGVACEIFVAEKCVFSSANARPRQRR